MIGSLATQVRQLSLRVAELEGLLEAARKRIAVYEDFDTQVQDSLSAALRAANQIRERAKVTAEAITQEARALRTPPVEELEATRIERDALRRAIDGAQAGAPSHAASPSAGAAVFQMSEMRTAATEALRGVFKELVDEIRATSSAPTTASGPQVYERRAPAPAETYTPPPSGYNPPAPEPQPHSSARPIVERRQAVPPVVEDVDVARVAQTPTPAPARPAPPPVAAVPQVQAPHAVPEPSGETWVTPSEPIGEVQVVLSPISSFPRLVELERRLQGMPAVRTVYARDFRNGVATLAIGLRNPMTVDEFATAVTRLEYPRLRVVSTTGYVLELRIDAEASSIA